MYGFDLSSVEVMQIKRAAWGCVSITASAVLPHRRAAMVLISLRRGCKAQVCSMEMRAAASAVRLHRRAAMGLIFLQ